MSNRVRMVHASGNTFMSLANTQEDVEHILDLNPAPLWLTVTEAGGLDTLHAINKEVRRKRAPYNLLNPDGGDIAFLLHHNARLLDSGGPLVIPGQPGPAREGGHGPRHNSFMRISFEDEIIFANGVHFVTRLTHGDHRTDRADLQTRQANLLGAQMFAQARGRNICVGSGDINGQLPNRSDLQKIWDKYGMTTTAEEEHNLTPTHDGNRIDYVWTMDKDGRVGVEKMKVLKSPVYNSDHDPIVVDLLIS